MQNYGKVLSEESEVVIGGEDRNLLPFRDGTDQKIRIRSLNSSGAALVEEFRGPFVVGRRHLEIGKGTQAASKLLELRGFPNAREQLLADHSQQFGPHFPDKLGQLHDGRLCRRRLAAAQGQGPDAGVNQDAQPRLLCFL